MRSAWDTMYLLSCGRASLLDRNAHYPQHGRDALFIILTGHLTIFSFQDTKKLVYISNAWTYPVKNNVPCI